jgi:hypothetical protein
MFRALKAYLGFGQDGTRESFAAAVADTPVGDMAAVRHDLERIQVELDQVEKSISDSKALVAKATAQEFEMRSAIAQLSMEMHDTFLHPEFAELDDAEEADNAAPATPSALEDDDDAKAVEEQRRQRQASRGLRVKMAHAVSTLERRVLPQLIANRDELDLTTFRLRLRMDKLRQEELATQQRLSAAQAELFEARTIYTDAAAGARSDDFVVPRPDDDVQSIVAPNESGRGKPHPVLVPVPQVSSSSASAAAAQSSASAAPSAAAATSLVDDDDN